jgi:hypothetical protein
LRDRFVFDFGFDFGLAVESTFKSKQQLKALLRLKA